MQKIERNIRLLTLFNFFLDFRPYAPIAIIFFSQVTGSYALGMSVFSIIMVTQTIFELPMGVVSDYIGRKKTLIIGSLFSLFGILLYAGSVDFTTLMVGAICEGLSRTFFSGNNSALLFESLKQVNRERDFAQVSGRTNSMFQLALSVSAFLSSLVALNYSLSILFWITAIPQLIMVVVSLFVVEPHIHSEKMENNIFAHLAEATRNFLKNKKLRLLVWSDAIGYAIGEASHELVPAFVALVWPAWASGIFRGLVHTFGFVGFYFSGIFIQKFGLLKSLFMTSIIGYIVPYIALFLSNIFSPLLMALTSLLYGTEHTAGETLQQQEFSERQRATMGSVSAMMGSVLFAISAILLGSFADKHGIIATLFLTQILMTVCIYLKFRLFKEHA